jgi:hypothetical protein
LSIERSDVERILQKVERVQPQLLEIRSDLQSLLGEETEFAPPNWLKDRLKVWKAIVDRGGVVTRGELYEIADEQGYKRRGLGGFFAGPDSSLVEVGSDKIGIRKWALDEVEKYRRWLNSHEEE